MKLLQASLSYVASHLSVIPCWQRSKRPRVTSWKAYQQVRPTRAELFLWFGPLSSTDGLAIVTGGVSGQLEVVDFDAPALFAPWYAQVEVLSPGLLAALPIVQTQGGGFHVYFRSVRARGNQKLAVDPARPGGKYTLIETRGEGGYVLAPPTEGYRLRQGDLASIPSLQDRERTLLLELARRFSQAKRAVRLPHNTFPSRSRGGGERPGDDYNRRGDLFALLERHGWRLVRYTGEESHWRRPGKWLGTSATFNYEGNNLFYVFTTNAPPFEPERAYSRFGVYAFLEHGGDFEAAAQALRRHGFGRSATGGPS